MTLSRQNSRSSLPSTPTTPKSALQKKASIVGMNSVMTIPSIQIEVVNHSPFASVSSTINEADPREKESSKNVQFNNIGSAAKSPASVIKRKDSVFTNTTLERIPSGQQKYEFVEPTLLCHNPQTVNDLYARSLIEKTKGVGSASTTEAGIRAKSRPHTAKPTYSRRNGNANDDEDENTLNSARTTITSADLIGDSGAPSKSKTAIGKRSKREGTTDVTLLGISGMKHLPPNEALPYSSSKNPPKSNAEHLILRHSTELLNSESLNRQITSDYYENLEQDLWKFEHVSRGKHRNVMVTHGNTVRMFNRGEPVEVFFNKYLLYQKDLMEKNEDFETMQQTMKKIRQRARSAVSPVKPQKIEPPTADKQIVFTRKPLENKETNLSENLYERKKKKRLKPIAQFVQEQVSQYNDNLEQGNGNTFLTEINIQAKSQLVIPNAQSQQHVNAQSTLIPTPSNLGRRSSIYQKGQNQSMAPLSARSVTSSVITGSGFDLYVTDNQVDYAERNKKSKTGLIDTIKRASGANERPKGDYVTGVNHSAKTGIGGIVARFPAEELKQSGERLKRTKAKEPDINCAFLNEENDEEDYTEEDLNKVFPPIKISSLLANTTIINSGANSSNSSCSSLHGLLNPTSVTPSTSFREGTFYSSNFGSSVDHIIENIRAKIHFKNYNSDLGDLDSEALKEQIVDEEHEQMIDEKLHQYDVDFKNILNDVSKTSSVVVAPSTLDNSTLTENQVAYNIKKQSVEINGETFYKTKDTSPRKNDHLSSMKKKKDVKKVKIRNINSGTWRNNFIASQAKMQYDLLTHLDDRSDNRNVVKGSNEHLKQVSEKVLEGAEKVALFRITGSSKKVHNNDSLWDKSKKKLDTQTNQFYQSVLFYKRMTMFLDIIQAPTSSCRLLISFLNRIRNHLIKNPLNKHTKDTLFFPLFTQVIEEGRMEGQLNETEESSLDVFFNSRETFKVLQFLNAEFSFSSEELFSYLNRMSVRQNKNFTELKIKLKQKEEEAK